MELTPDEVREVEQRRAMKAVQSKPISRDDVAPEVISAIMSLARILYRIDPTGKIWRMVAERVEEKQ